LSAWAASAEPKSVFSTTMNYPFTAPAAIPLTT
jgi:hypothetical protein